jgi:hypothetical protein
MPYIKVEDFSGIVPRTGPTRLDPNQAQIANNVKLQSRELRSWALPHLEFVPTTPLVETIYRIDSPSGEKYWLEWDTEVDMVPGPVADIDEFRYYYTGDGKPKKTNWDLATTGGLGSRPFPDAWLYMGVPNPTGAPTLVASSSSGTVETRAYVYTYVSEFGDVKEESGPSPAATVTVTTSGATVTVSGFTAPPTTGYNITARRIYRTITGATTVTYSFVAEIPLATTSYVDSKTVAELGSELPSLYWAPPPDDLKGLVALPNGMLVGFIGNQVWFSEPYYPHAWPEQYMLTVDYPIVGLGVYETNVVVCTTRYPYLISGVSPTSMSQQKLPIPQPCVSKRSIASDQYGVLYASPNGLVSLGSGSQDVVTVPLYTRDEWQALDPYSMVGAVYNNMYMGFSNVAGTIKGIVISRGDIPPLINFDFPTRSLFIDRSTSDIYAVNDVDNKVYHLDASEVNFTTYEWKSKKFVLPNPVNFGAVKVQADYTFMNDIDAYIAYVNEIKSLNAILFVNYGGNVEGQLNTGVLNQFTLNGSLLLDIPEQGTNRFITLIVYADGEIIYQADVLSQEPLRMPALQKGYVYELLVSGNTPVRFVAMASSIGELRQLGD